MNPELLKLLGQAAPLVAEWLAKPKPRIDEIEMTGERFIQFLKVCTSQDVQLLANAIDPEAVYSFTPEALRELAMPLPPKLA